MCRVPKDDGQDNWLCQECIDKCPPGDWDNCVVRPRTTEADASLSAPTAHGRCAGGRCYIANDAVMLCRWHEEQQREDAPPLDADAIPCMHGQAPDRRCTSGDYCSCGCFVCRPYERPVASDAVPGYVSPKDGDPTPSLDAFLAAYERDENEWWRLSCGHHQNLFESADERADIALTALRYISSPTMGLPGGRDALDFVDEASETNIREALKACIRTARMAISKTQPDAPLSTPSAPRPSDG